MKRLTLSDRKIIEKLRNTNRAGVRLIGRVVGVSHSVIIYELTHHAGEHLPYNAERAHALCLRNQEKKGNKSKIECNDKLREYIKGNILFVGRIIDPRS